MSVRILNRLLFLLLSLLSCNLFAQCVFEDDRAFYALSSLRFYLQQQISEDAIHFTEEDVHNLWEDIAQITEVYEIEKAKKHWAIASKKHEGFEKHLNKTKMYLKQAWEQLNVFIHPISGKGGAHAYFLPRSHALHRILDDIFARFPDAIADEVHFVSAGFKSICNRTSKMIVAQHSLLPKHLLKLYLHSDKENLRWKWLVNRCLGADNIRRLIKAKNLRYFTVPDKWIYPLVEVPREQQSNAQLALRVDPAVLVVTNMKIKPYEQSRDAWKNKITLQHLKELYCILSHGFGSCYLANNIPYTRGGKFTCIDTEYPYRIHRMEKVKSHLSEEMKDYWDILVKTGGKL